MIDPTGGTTPAAPGRARSGGSGDGGFQSVFSETSPRQPPARTEPGTEAARSDGAEPARVEVAAAATPRDGKPEGPAGEIGTFEVADAAHTDGADRGTRARAEDCTPDTGPLRPVSAPPTTPADPLTSGTESPPGETTAMGFATPVSASGDRPHAAMTDEPGKTVPGPLGTARATSAPLLAETGAPRAPAGTGAAPAAARDIAMPVSARNAAIGPIPGSASGPAGLPEEGTVAGTGVAAPTAASIAPSTGPAGELPRPLPAEAPRGSAGPGQTPVPGVAPVASGPAGSADDPSVSPAPAKAEGAIPTPPAPGAVPAHATAAEGLPARSRAAGPARGDLASSRLVASASPPAAAVPPRRGALPPEAIPAARLPDAAGPVEMSDVTVPDTLPQPETVQGDRSGPEALRHARGVPALVEAPRPAMRLIADSLHRAPDGAVELTLSPEELGRVRLTLNPAEHGITVSITAERGETLELMRRHADLLSGAMRELGYGEVVLDFGGNGAGLRQGPPDRAAPGSAETDAGLQAAQETATAPSRSGTGGLDLRM